MIELRPSQILANCNEMDSNGNEMIKIAVKWIQIAAISREFSVEAFLLKWLAFKHDYIRPLCVIG